MWENRPTLKFEATSGLLNVIAQVCTDIARAPSKYKFVPYMDNVQVICDSNMFLTNLVAQWLNTWWPGSTGSRLTKYFALTL